MDIDIDDSKFGIWLEKHIHRSNAKSYNQKWYEFFEKYNFDDDLISKLELLDAIKYIEETGRIW